LCTPLTPILTAATTTLGFEFCLDHMCHRNSIVVHRFMRCHLVINTVLIAFFVFLFVLLIALAVISLRGEVTRVPRVITNGAVL
jgi:large-conductance mechanosensitive channel